ncbi:zf-HC2 domain-containing protein [Faucicola boevrei]|uniref:zf-HC2 domain-containing protein n=1 Tax=Faucicola boevrei TaxID=346665 RepID=UPI00037427F0|nr:hypothetical protein [Moraxella boevrei]
MKNCEQISKLAILSLEQPLTWQQKMQLQTHLLLCRHCRAFDKNNKILSQILKTYHQQDDKSTQHTTYS